MMKTVWNYPPSHHFIKCFLFYIYNIFSNRRNFFTKICLFHNYVDILLNIYLLKYSLHDIEYWQYKLYLIEFVYFTVDNFIHFHVGLIKVITKLPNSEQSYKGKVKTHNYINRQNQSTTGKL